MAAATGAGKWGRVGDCSAPGGRGRRRGGTAAAGRRALPLCEKAPGRRRRGGGGGAAARSLVTHGQGEGEAEGGGGAACPARAWRAPRAHVCTSPLHARRSAGSSRQLLSRRRSLAVTAAWHGARKSALPMFSARHLRAGWADAVGGRGGWRGGGGSAALVQRGGPYLPCHPAPCLTTQRQASPFHRSGRGKEGDALWARRAEGACASGFAAPREAPHLKMRPPPGSTAPQNRARSSRHSASRLPSRRASDAPASSSFSTSARHLGAWCVRAKVSPFGHVCVYVWGRLRKAALASCRWFQIGTPVGNLSSCAPTTTMHVYGARGARRTAPWRQANTTHFGSSLSRASARHPVTPPPSGAALAQCLTASARQASAIAKLDR